MISSSKCSHGLPALQSFVQSTGKTMDLPYLVQLCHHHRYNLVLLLVLFLPQLQGKDYDVCVYGATSGGVVAALQADRMGKSVILLEPYQHVGGMTSSGLSALDVGNPATIGGITREYFSKLAARYGKELSFENYFAHTGGDFVIEPSGAEKLFLEYLAESEITVRYDKKIRSAQMDDTKIISITMEDGSYYHAKVFIDATYEGDLMATAGVSYTTTREANSKYNETGNGFSLKKYTPSIYWGVPGDNGRRADRKGIWDRDIPISPYLDPTDKNSGLLPTIKPYSGEQNGEEAQGVQAYCFRLCMTDNPDNRIPINKPDNYDPWNYEIQRRFIQACVLQGDDMDIRWFTKLDPLVNDKWDFNTATFGSNIPGLSWDWPDADWDRRQDLYDYQRDYHMGLLYFLANDPVVPEKLKKQVRSFGLCKDEFVDNGGWPYQLYIREARRMISDLVMNENHCTGKLIAGKSVAMASYGLDIHEIQRIAYNDMVVREGKSPASVRVIPYGIGYNAIVPKKDECTNLLVTFAVSASHVAFGSIRMEPTFMMLSQSAATAACQMIDQRTSIQNIDYSTLRKTILTDGQILSLPNR